MTSQPDTDKHGPGLKFPPPLLPLGIVLLGYLLDLAAPLPISESEFRWIAGAGVVGIAFAFALIALKQFFSAKTHVEPWQPTTRIIQHGIYAFSRNPIYLAFAIATAGMGLILDSWWILIGIAPLLVLLQLLVVRREEAYLEAKFGDDYRQYRQRVRRWF